MIVTLNSRSGLVATLNMPFPPVEGDRIYLCYQDLLSVQSQLDPGERLNVDALKRLQDLDGTSWIVQVGSTWEMRFHRTGNYDPILRVNVVQT